MARYFGAFPAGTQEIVKAVLTERLSDLHILSLFDGCVDFETAVSYSDLNLFCFQNMFQVLYAAPVPGDKPLNRFLESLSFAPVDWEPVKSHPKSVKTFRVVTSEKNQLTAVDPALRSALEKRLQKLSGLRLDRSRPDTEFWALSRSEGVCWFLKRLSRHKSYEKLLNPGELHPEIAYLMCWLSRPAHTDVVLDPFCGFGSIPFQRCKRFPYQKMLAFDFDQAVLQKAREKLKSIGQNLVLKRQDVLELQKALGPETVDAVVTDPPWGLYQDVGMDLVEFYRQTLNQLWRVLKPGGRLILLTAKKDEFSGILENFDGFRLQNLYHILVSGKKAGIFCLEKPVARNLPF